MDAQEPSTELWNWTEDGAVQRNTLGAVHLHEEALQKREEFCSCWVPLALDALHFSRRYQGKRRI